jgi:hypothetical protein
MSHTQKVLLAAMPSIQELDSMIAQMETNLGKAHSVSPFAALYAQNNVKFTTKPEKSAAPKEEVKKEEVKKEEP